MAKKKVLEMIEDALMQRWSDYGEEPTAVLMTPVAKRILEDELGRKIGSTLGTSTGAVSVLTSVLCPLDTMYFGQEIDLLRMVGESEHMYLEDGRG